MAAHELKAVVTELREECRIKLGTDWGYTLKFHRLHVLCADVFHGTIQRVFEAHGIRVDTFHTYR